MANTGGNASRWCARSGTEISGENRRLSLRGGEVLDSVPSAGWRWSLLGFSSREDLALSYTCLFGGK